MNVKVYDTLSDYTEDLQQMKVLKEGKLSGEIYVSFGVKPNPEKTCKKGTYPFLEDFRFELT
jgi:hypothetical protein